MARRRRLPVVADKARRTRLEEWLSAVMGPAVRLCRKKLEFIGQMTEHRFLFLSDERYPRKPVPFLLDARTGRLERLRVPVLEPYLGPGAYGSEVLRFDASTGLYFRCSSVDTDSPPGFGMIGDGKTIRGNCWVATPTRVSALFVTADRVFLIDEERNALIGISKPELIERAFGAEPRESVIFDPDAGPGNAGAIGHTEVRAEGLDGGPGPLWSAFSVSRLIYWRSDRLFAESPAYPRLRAYAPGTGRFEEHRFPSFAKADFGAIVDWAVNDRDKFERYLAFLSLFEVDPGDNDAPPLLFTENGVLYGDAVYRACRLEAITEEKVTEFADVLGFRFGQLMSEDRDVREDGLFKMIDSSFAFGSEEEREFVRDRLDRERLETAEWEKLSGDKVDRFFLDSLAKVIDLSEGRTALAKRWLKRNPARQYVALALLKGKVLPPGPAAVLGDDGQGLGGSPNAGRQEDGFASEAEIPVSEVRQLAERWFRELQDLEAVDWEESTDAQRAELENRKTLLAAVAGTAISWETEDGNGLVRWLDARGRGFLKGRIAELIGDSKAYALLDLIGRYLDGDDPDVAADALLALWHDESGDFEEAMLRWLRSAEDVVPGRAAYALGSRVRSPAVLPLFYSGIISVAGEPDGGRYRTTIQENEALEELFRAIFRMGGFEPRRKGDPSARELAGMAAYAPYYALYLAQLAFHRDPYLAKRDRDPFGTGGRPEMLAFIKRIMAPGNDGDWAVFDLELLGRIARWEDQPLEAVETVLRLFFGSTFPPDVKYLLALHAVFAPGIAESCRPGGAAERILILTADVLDRMSKEDDHRGVFAIFALVELGVGRGREREALEIVRRGDWRGWPRLARLAERVMSYLPAERRADIYEACLLASFSPSTVSHYAKDLARADPRRAVALYERGQFELDRFDEAMFYGRAGDRRGYDLILRTFTKRGDIEAIDLLGDLGGAEAVAALEEARYKHSAPRASVAKAIRKIRRRMEGEGGRPVSRRAAAGRKRT